MLPSWSVAVLSLPGPITRENQRPARSEAASSGNWAVANSLRSPPAWMKTGSNTGKGCGRNHEATPNNAAERDAGGGEQEQELPCRSRFVRVGAARRGC